jgi:hypothetical protein
VLATFRPPYLRHYCIYSRQNDSLTKPVNFLIFYEYPEGAKQRNLPFTDVQDLEKHGTFQLVMFMPHAIPDYTNIERQMPFCYNTEQR